MRVRRREARTICGRKNWGEGGRSQRNPSSRKPPAGGGSFSEGFRSFLVPLFVWPGGQGAAWVIAVVLLPRRGEFADCLCGGSFPGRFSGVCLARLQ